jgi:hypothetical protein
VAGLLPVVVLLLWPWQATADEPEASEAGLGFAHPLQTDHTVLSQGPVHSTAPLHLHTYCFFFNGVDPGNAANFYGLSQFVKSYGYPQTYFGQMTAGNYYLRRIREIHAYDPQARFVLVGFSGGTYVIRNIANTVRNEGIIIDLLVYIGGDMIYNTSYSQPDNVVRILNVTGGGFCLTGGNLITNGDTLDRATNVRIPIYHFGLPSHHDTIQALLHELDQVPCSPPPVQH